MLHKLHLAVEDPLLGGDEFVCCVCFVYLVIISCLLVYPTETRLPLTYPLHVYLVTTAVLMLVSFIAVLLGGEVPRRNVYY